LASWRSAPWTWNRVKARLINLGLAAGKITETVDYYHASEYIHKIVAELPRKLAKRSASILKEFKHWLWEGKIEAILDKCRQCFARPSQAVSRYMGYLEKNKERMLYAQFREQKLVCGSGVIGSGIRRVINLRFKNASAFWLPENVQGLYFLRGILLAFRWNIWINNLV
jgi:hypothetical protein